jgi:hypothetical protein
MYSPGIYLTYGAGAEVDSSCSIDGRIEFESFIVTSTTSSSPSTDVATTLPSPEESASEAVVTIRSGSMLSLGDAELSSSVNAGCVEKVATFSRILR